MFRDAKLVVNMLEQASGEYGYRDTDFLQPGLLAGQTKMDVIKTYCRSILKHIKNMEINNEYFM